MKIVFLSPAAQGGGAEEALFDLVIALHALRPADHLHVILGESGPLQGRLEKAGIHVEAHLFPESLRNAGEQSSASRSFVPRFGRLLSTASAAGSLARYLLKMRRRLHQLAPDIIHSNGMKMHLAAALVRPKRSRLVWHLHDYVSTRRLTSHLLPRLSSRVDLVLANSRSVAADLRQVLPKSRIETLYNAVDLERFSPAGPQLDLDQLAGLSPAPAGTIRIGLIATFAHWKGQDVFLKAAQKCEMRKSEREVNAATSDAQSVLHNAPPTLIFDLQTSPAASSAPQSAIRNPQSPRPPHFYIIGGPVYATPGSQWTLQELNAQAAEQLGIADHVGFTGWIDDAPSALRALDIVVHASTKPEPFGLVIIQAMACGKPVIVSDAGGARELVEPEIDALTHPPGDADALATALERLIQDPALRHRLAKAGRAKVEQNFTRQQMAERAAEIYGSCNKEKATLS